MSVPTQTTRTYPLAPWAEIVPHVPPLTVGDLERLPDDGWRYELVEGVLVRYPVGSLFA